MKIERSRQKAQENTNMSEAISVHVIRDNRTHSTL